MNEIIPLTKFTVSSHPACFDVGGGSGAPGQNPSTVIVTSYKTFEEDQNGVKYVSGVKMTTSHPGPAKLLAAGYTQ